jgi:hypothetical protein
MDNTKNISLTHKILACLVTGIVTGYPVMRMNEHYIPNWIPRHLHFYLGFIIIIASISFIFIWQYLERNKKVNSQKTFTFLQGILIFSLTAIFMKWGLLKILRLHMTTSLGWMEMPMTMLSGAKQLSHFFGQSYPMVFILGLCEIVGGVLILFRKTRLLGLGILFVMTANIILIDILYKEYGPLPEAIILILGILYLALQDFDRIVNFFFKANDNIPRFQFDNKYIKAIIKILAVLIPIIILVPHREIQFREGITGKYNILKMTINGIEKPIEQCSDTTFSKVYFDLGDNFIFTNNNFTKKQIGHFALNETARTFETTWEYPKGLKDNFIGKMTPLDNKNRMKLTGTMAKDTFVIELEKMEVKNFNKTY